MEPRISYITLGVADLARSAAFYETVLGLVRKPGPPGVAFYPMGAFTLALWGSRELAAELGMTPAEGSAQSFRGFALAHNVGSPTEVDALLERAREAGGQVLKSGQDTTWGGYAGYFADVDGCAWEVVYNPKFRASEGG